MDSLVWMLLARLLWSPSVSAEVCCKTKPLSCGDITCMAGWQWEVAAAMQREGVVMVPELIPHTLSLYC